MEENSTGGCLYGVEHVGVSGLELHFYANRCPNAEMIVKQELRRSMLNDTSTAAALLRLAFHDCQVNVCDASILLKNTDGTTNEIGSDKNFGIRKLNIIHEIKSLIEKICPQIVSCADIIQLAAREAIFLTGGPYVQVLTGRRDSVFASEESADKELPTADISVEEFIDIFQQKNINLEAGSHTLGIGHCRNFVNRLKQGTNPTMSPYFGLMLKKICSDPSLTDIAFATNDATTLSFDNQYFLDILNGRGLLKIDSDIAGDPRTRPYVIQFGSNGQLFFQKFASGFLKLSSYKVLEGEEGEIRRSELNFDKF
ncbi:hem peroxidase [Dillenia turbinata]|uniref:Peroxidase n=1 Tax=Dillenia turbinata TaxID=194707 RepID=A0AAN8UHW6_9MAGN